MCCEEQTTIQTGADKKVRLVTEKLNDILSLLDVEGVVADGVADDSAGFADAVDDGRALFLPSATIKIDTPLTLSASTVQIEGTGETSVLDFSGGGSLKLSTPPTVLPDLASDIEAGESVFTFDGAHGLAEGDVFFLYNPVDSSFVNMPGRPYYRDGAMFRVANVPSTTTAEIYGVAHRSFAASDVDCYQMAGGRIMLRNLRIIPPPSGIPIWIDGHHGVVLEDINCEAGAADTCIEILRCFDFSATRVKSTALAGDAYPIAIVNSQNGRISDCQLHSNRHCISMGGRDEAGSVPVRDILVSNCVFLNNPSLGFGATDTHGNCEDIAFINCTINCVANMGGRNIRYANCTIFGRPPSITPGDGGCVYGSETVGGTFEFSDCRFITYGNGLSFGTIYLDLENRKEDFTLLVKDCSIESLGSGASNVRMVMLGLGTSAGSHRVDTVIDGLVYIGSAAFAALGLAGSADISALSSHVIDRVRLPGGTLLLAASNAANYNAPLRLQELTGTVSMTATSGTSNTIASPITLRYAYPRVPQGDCSAVGGYNSNRMTYGTLYTLTSTQIRPMIESGDATAWSATANDRPVNWRAGIREL